MKLLFKLFLLYFLILGLIFTFLVPPFQKPDEYTHFNKTLLISKGIFNCNQKSFEYEKKYDLLRQNDKINIIPFHYPII